MGDLRFDVYGAYKVVGKTKRKCKVSYRLCKVLTNVSFSGQMTQNQIFLLWMKRSWMKIGQLLREIAIISPART